MSNYERIKNSVQAAGISNDDKKILLDIFAEITDEHLSEIAGLFEKKSTWVGIFNDNRKKKIEAFKKNDQSLMAEILAEEKKYLNDLTYGLD